MKRAFSWTISNADTLIALGLAIVVTILSLAGAVSTTLVANATVLTLAVLAFIMLHDRKIQGDTKEELGRLGRKFDERNPIRILTGAAEIGRTIADARRSTEQWFFRGSTATYVRVTVIPECIKQARNAGNKEFRARLEMLDPTSNVACENYIRLYQGLADGPHSPEMSWTVKGTRIELYATILAICWHKQRYDLFTVEIGLTETASTFRWEASSHYFILTQRGPRFPAMLIGHTDPFYSLLVSELNASFRQARHLRLELAREVNLSDEPTVEEARALFSRLGIELPTNFTSEDISEIISKALHYENPYKDTGS